MKNKHKELDVDFIGGQGPMTKEDELAISKAIRAAKEKRKLQPQRKVKTRMLKSNKQPV